MEDSEKRTVLVDRLLSGKNSCKIPRTTHLHLRTSKSLRLESKDPVWRKCRGAEQRNHGIDWLKKSAAKGLLESTGKSDQPEGVVYFGDDDNTYDLEVFKEVYYALCITKRARFVRQYITSEDLEIGKSLNYIRILLCCFQMRFTKMVSIWPVGLSGGMKFEGPTCEGGRVTGWYAVWDKTRKFQVDMAGKPFFSNSPKYK